MWPAAAASFLSFQTATRTECSHSTRPPRRSSTRTGSIGARGDHGSSPAVSRFSPRAARLRPMIEMQLARIVIRETSDQQSIYLREKGGDRQFPIVIGI